ncbi:aquaporin AQPcic-like [Tribolium madens]|uniref:aquaporin AQPcic-like n=1 Tax=Tribolium madens TaxID=41895 RepID=UPI001CF735F0|nr:aquaporin AQPcic-like [Tribolium madens]
MLDTQFSSQNGGGAPGISFIVAPPGAVTPEHNKWVANEPPRHEGKKIQVGDNLTTMDRVVICASEVCATAILVFLGCAGCINFGIPPTHLQICLTFGLAVMVSVQCFGHISGSHINPVVTVAAATLGNIPLIQVPIYFVGQMLGALTGFGLVKLATPTEYFETNSTSVGLCSPALHPGVTPFQGLLIEFLISLMLTLVCCGVWDCRNNTKHDSVPIRFGLTITVLALVGVPYGGGNMNPARSFAPALINGDWENHWIYWVGPLSAGFIGALFYRFLFGKEPVEDEQGNVAETIAVNDKA